MSGRYEGALSVGDKRPVLPGAPLYFSVTLDERFRDTLNQIHDPATEYIF